MIEKIARILKDEDNSDKQEEVREIMEKGKEIIIGYKRTKARMVGEREFESLTT